MEPCSISTELGDEPRPMSIAADANGKYPIPVPKLNSGSRSRSSFKFGRTGL